MKPAHRKHSSRLPIITLDGPAGAGKTTTARELARRLNFVHLDTGAMYRALALKVLRAGVPLDDPRQIAQQIRDVTLELRFSDHRQRVILEGEDVTESLRSAEVTHAVSPVCEVPEVRTKLVELQQRLGERGGIVAEGRDMGTVVFPQAELKIFLVADLNERAQRRLQEIEATGQKTTLVEVLESLRERDRRDQQRTLSPLQPAPDAVIIDTTQLNFEQQVEEILRHFAHRCGSVTS